MDAKKRIDKILSSALERTQEEVGGLLGVSFKLDNPQYNFTSKTNFFESIIGKQILAKIDLTGEIEGQGCLAIGIKDAVRLGGTLIMLPASELDEVVGREEYNEETEDSYGEIANIIAGSFTKEFEESHPKSFRFVRKEQEVIVPTKIDIESDEPIPEQQYYWVQYDMSLDDRELGNLHMVIPGEPLGLEQQEQEAKSEPEPQAAEPAEAAVEQSEPPQEQEAPQQPAKKKVDPDKHRARIDKLLEECRQKMGDEVSALLGVDASFDNLSNSFINKEELFFDTLEGKQVMADLEISGDRQEQSQLFMSLKSAIHVGGTLIMLPSSELEGVVNEEDLSEDIKDAYGEIVNIISGVYTAVFEEQYTEHIRFIKRDVHELVPMKVEVDSDEPILDRPYYVSSQDLTLDGQSLGKIHTILPAEPFMLEGCLAPEAEAEAGEAQQPGAEQGEAEPADTAVQDDPPVVETATAVAVSEQDIQDAAKQKKRVDKLFKECSSTIQEEIGALLGVEVSLQDMENRLLTKEDFFFDVAEGKQIQANMDVVGDLEDNSYFYITLRDAITVGGTLIMLPPSELEVAVAEESFSADSEDAYGEIANIISGVYTAVFEEQYSKKIRFIKTGLQQVVPMAVDIESTDPLANQEYYVSTMSMSIDSNELGKVHMLCPAAMLELEALDKEVSEGAAAATVAGDGVAAVAGAATGTAQPAATGGAAQVQGAGGAEQIDRSATAIPDILVIGDDEEEIAQLVSGAEVRGLAVRQISFKDNVKQAFTEDLKAVYIITKSVDDQLFGMAIKVSTICSLPIIAAGPAWTRSKVIKAVKYGVNDILLTPASNDDVQENLENNLVQMAA